MWDIGQGIQLRAVHLLELSNAGADALSRGTPWIQTSDWMLNPGIFRRLCDRWSVFPEVGECTGPSVLFLWLDPEVWKVNAVSFPWVGYSFYAFLHPVLVPLVLQKIRDEGTLSLLLIAPFLSTRPFFQLSRARLLADHPISSPVGSGSNLVSGTVCIGQTRYRYTLSGGLYPGVLPPGGSFGPGCRRGVKGAASFHASPLWSKT